MHFALHFKNPVIKVDHNNRSQQLTKYKCSVAHI